MAQGRGSFLRFSNIRRHGNLTQKQKRQVLTSSGPQRGISWTHELALRAWVERSRTPADSGGVAGSAAALPGSVAGSAGRPPGRVVAEPRPHEAGALTFLALRIMLETRGSFRDFSAWSLAAVGRDRAQTLSWKIGEPYFRTMVQYERFTTKALMEAASVYRLAADGLRRAYQVEIGAVVWKFPAKLKHRQSTLGQMESLGRKGPWIVSRLVGMRELSGEMGLDGKVHMVEAAVRELARKQNGTIDVDLHQHVSERVRVWTSDGADQDVGLALSGGFSHLAFHAWDESHSAGRLLQHALRHDAEIKLVDELLVTGKKPYSLAKFLSTSDVFRKKVGDAQAEQDVAFVRNFGWAPQRFQSRARPYARAARRWNAIWSAVAAEASSTNRERRDLAQRYLVELGGANSPRLLLGGMLADLAAEHYTWVSSGDADNPDTTTVIDRVDAFVRRLEVLFDEGFVMRQDTFTSTTLDFLKETTFYQYGKNSVATFGIGDFSSPAVQALAKGALRRMQGVVANIKELLHVYRPRDSWLQDFAAFALPSPLQAVPTAASGEAAVSAAKKRRATAVASLWRICEAAGLVPKDAIAELVKLKPRAQMFFDKHGCNPRQAWGQAAAEFPELKLGRELVGLFLVWKTSTGNVERRFRVYSEFHTRERAKLLETSVEDCMIADQAPSSTELRRLLEHPPPDKNYLQELDRFRAGHFPGAKTRGRYHERRDAGVNRSKANGDEGEGCLRTEAAFGRKRAAAVSKAVAASPAKRARMMDKMPWLQPGVGWD